MLENLLKFNLQLFGEGGDGADGGASSAGEGAGLAEESGDNIPAFIPEKARKTYQKAMARTKNRAQASEGSQTVEEDIPPTSTHIAYSDLIKSDEYKEEHQAYMDKTIGDRLKKYKGMEENFGKAKDILDIVAAKYGVDPTSETFFDELRERAEADDSYYEQYAMEHDISADEARRIVTMERKVKNMEAQEEAARQEEAQRQQVQILLSNAERTKTRFPDFDLETEMQNEAFRRLVAASNGDTTAAYQAIHFDEIMQTQMRVATQQVQQQTANAVKANKSRPIENGLSSQPASVVEQDFRHMNLDQIRAYAAEQRRKQRS